MKRVAIVLDSNQFGKPNNYNFKDGKCVIFAKHFLDYNNIDIFIPDIVVEELKSHIRESINESYKLLDCKYIKETVNKNMINKIINKNIEYIDKYINDYNIKIIECSKLGKLGTICEWYFSLENPFEERKKDEFPDAIIVSGLKEYFRKNKYSKIFVCSDDKGFKKGILNNLANVEVGTINDVMKQYIDITVEEYKNIEHYIFDGLEIDDIELLSNESEDCLDIDYITQTINDVTIMDVIENEYMVCVNVDLLLEGDYCIIDPFLSFYDKEEPSKSITYIRLGDKIKISNLDIYVFLTIKDNKLVGNIKCAPISLYVYDYIKQLDIAD